MERLETTETAGQKRSWLRRPLFWAGAVLVLLAAGQVPIVRSGWTEKARIAKIQQDLKAIIHAAEIYRTATGRAPRTLEELAAGKDAKGEDIGFSLSSTRDPWNNDYLFEVDSKGKFRARCLGQDQGEGGEGPDQDYIEIDDGGR
jgi:type II secretory pathway pseudopilin PulG